MPAQRASNDRPMPGGLSEYQLILVYVGLFTAVGMTFFLVVLIAGAYASGGTMTVNVNVVEEGAIEVLVFALVGLPVVTLGLHYALTGLHHSDDENGS